MTIKVKANTRKGWQEAYSLAKNNIKNEKIIDFYVQIPDDKSKDSSDVTNLKYLFPIANALSLSAKISFIISCNEEDSRRVKQFLRYSKIDNQVIINGEKIKFSDISYVSPKKRYTTYASDIVPLLKATNENYTLLSEPYSDTNETCAFGSAIRNFYYEFIIANNCDNKKTKSKKNVIYEQVGKYIKNDHKKVQNRLNREISSLAFLILCSIIHAMLDDDQLFDLGDKKHHINQSIFNKILADAETYAEGLYQIIENACMYSPGRCAFFGMRMHKVNRQAKVDSLDKEAKTRVRLYRKYKNCIKKEWRKTGKSRRTVSNHIFNSSDSGTDYTYFLEFYVLDDSVKTEIREKEGYFYGIVPHYNSDKAEKISSIRDIIEMTEKKYNKTGEIGGEFYYIHYGLRWFEKIVSKNKGLMFILSPNGNNVSCYRNIPLDINANTVQEVDKEDPCEVDAAMVFSTEYSVLLPMSYGWEYSAVENKIGAVNSTILDTRYIDRLPELRKLAVQWKGIRISKGIKDNNKKIENINIICANIEKSWCKLYDSANIDPSLPQIIYIELIKHTDGFGSKNNLHLSHIELIAKALFKFIYMHHDKQLRIAVNFQNNDGYIAEFVRIFTIFYDKSNTCGYMENVQIALCSTNTENEPNEVNFLLAGENLSSAYETASIFMHYSSENTLQYIPLLKYLIGDSNKQAQPVAQFPFDLILGSELIEQEADEGCWFLNRMENALECSISKKQYGCKIENLHIRISSRIHLHDFYEAELLFHNIGNVYRFAYLIVGKILKSCGAISDNSNILLIGYENYSSMLLLEVSSLLKNTANASKVNIYNAIVTTSENDVSKNVISYISGEPNVTQDTKFKCFTVIPIGTTMSTIYKLHNTVRENLNSFSKNLKHHIDFEMNFSIVVVNRYLHPQANIQESEQQLIEKYWDLSAGETDKNQKVISLRRQYMNESNTKVHYFLVGDAEWQEATECKWCFEENPNESLPLVQVDKTSTLPKAITTLDNYEPRPLISKASGEISNLPTIEQNNKRLNFLAPSWDNDKVDFSVQYSHLYRGSNHYQFYLDFEKIAIAANKELIKWAEKQKIEQNAFNVVISPLNINNSAFLKIMIDNAFSTSLRFLHIDILNTVKEDARTKFKYIAEEFKRIKKCYPNLKINIYYVDDAILRGYTINRAKMLVKMLLAESKIENYSDIEIFKKVFLMVNRNSYDTMNCYVNHPEQNLHAFISLFVPFYNTDNNYCPGCNVMERYDLLRKRSSFPSVAKEFARLSRKHRKRTTAEYEEWLSEEILHNHSYFMLLKLWLFHFGIAEEALFYEKASKLKKSNKKRKEPTVLFSITAALRTFSEKLLTNNGIMPSSFSSKDNNDAHSIICDSFLRTMADCTLSNFIDFIISNPDCKDKKIIEQIKSLTRYIVAEQEYLRLETINNAYYRLIYSFDSCEDRTKATSKAYDIILELLLDCLNEKSQYMLFERMISYLKVISREHLAEFYHIRTAVFRIMEKMLALLLSDNPKNDYNTEQNDKWKRIMTAIRNVGIGDHAPICPWFQYQLFWTLVNRLALLQSTRVYDAKNIEKAIKMYENLEKKYFEEALLFDGNIVLEEFSDTVLFTELPQQDFVIKKYIAALKTATMLTRDDAPCTRLIGFTIKSDEAENRYEQ